MDLLTHTLSGIAVGTVIAGISLRGFKEKRNILMFSGLGGAFPDIDAISLWPGFDKTFGKLFGLSHAGKDIYVSKYWYSHHGFFHSLLASLLIAMLIGLLFHIVQKNKTFIHSLKDNSLILTGFVAGFVLHLLEDMPTPTGAWAGVRLFWPFNIYIGGWGNIWWWNNYDIFLMVVGVIVVNLLILRFNRKFKAAINKTTILVLLVAIVLCIFQIKTRRFNFNPDGKKKLYERYEIKSKEIQRIQLGKRTYKIMEKFDGLVPLNF
jgi:inner membrane protein